MTTPAIEMVDGLPIFSAIEPASIKPAIEKAIAACKSEISEYGTWVGQHEGLTMLTLPSKRLTNLRP